MNNDYGWLGEYRGTISLEDDDRYKSFVYVEFLDDEDFVNVKLL